MEKIETGEKDKPVRVIKLISAHVFVGQYQITNLIIYSFFTFFKEIIYVIYDLCLLQFVL